MASRDQNYASSGAVEVTTAFQTTGMSTLFSRGDAFSTSTFTAPFKGIYWCAANMRIDAPSGLRMRLRVSSIPAATGDRWKAGLTTYVGATPRLRVIVKFTVKFPVCSKPKTHTYGVFDCEFDYDSQAWSCSHRGVSYLIPDQLEVF